MEVNLNNQRYVFQWEYITDEGKTQEFIANSDGLIKGVPYKAQRYNAMAICRVKVPGTVAGKDGKIHLEQIAEGCSFCRKDEKLFDKTVARRLSLTHVLKNRPDLFTQRNRTEVWSKFNSQFPPVKPNAGLWEKKYTKAAMRVQELQRQLDSALRRIDTLARSIQPSEAV